MGRNTQSKRNMSSSHSQSEYFSATRQLYLHPRSQIGKPNQFKHFRCQHTANSSSPFPINSGTTPNTNFTLTQISEAVMQSGRISPYQTFSQTPISFLPPSPTN